MKISLTRNRTGITRIAVCSLAGFLLSGLESFSTETIHDLPPLGVVGSQLPLAMEERFAPVTLLTSEDLTLFGAQTPIEGLRRLPGLMGSTATENDSNAGTGAAGINLRGMGASSTLVLINGRRAGSFSDVNQIPLAALRSVQVLQAGAAATYGADALAGAVDFQFNDSPESNRIHVLYGNTSRRDSSVYQAGFLTGMRNGSLHITLAGEVYRRGTIQARDRAVSRSSDLRPYGAGNLGDPFLAGTAYFFNPAVSGFGHGILREGVDNPQSLADYRAFDYQEDLYNYREMTPAIPGQERYSFYGSARMRLSDNVSVFGDVLLSDIQQFNGYAAAPFGVPYDSPYTNLLDADSVPYPVYRTVELGPRSDTFRFNSLRTVFGLRGQVENFNWESAFLYNRAKGHNSMSGFPELNALIPLVNSGAFNPYGRAFSTGTATINGLNYSWDNAQALRDAGGQARDHYDSVLRVWDFKINGPLFEIPGGEVDVAVGIEYRDEDSGTEPDVLIQEGRALGFNQLFPFHAGRSVRAGFAEARVPLVGEGNRLPGLFAFDLNAGVRHERFRYDGEDPATGMPAGPRFRSTDSKFGFRYQPSSEWTLRSSYSTAFRAPTPNEIFSAGGTEFPTVVDPLGFSPGLFQTMVSVSGNIDLQPETSRTWSLGGAWSPEALGGFFVSADYYNVERRNVIGDSTQLILNLNAEGQGQGYPDVSNPSNVVFDPAAPFADRISRNPDGSLGQSRVHIDAERFNVAANKIEGFEIFLRYDHSGLLEGSLRHEWMFNYILKWDLITAPGTPAQSFAGRFRDPNSDDFAPGSIPRFQGYYRLVYERSQWLFSGTINHVDSFEDDHFFLETIDSRKVGSWTTVDALVQYSFTGSLHALTSDLSLTLGATNLLDRAPPVAVGAFNDNYDTSTHSIRGRSFYLRVAKEW